jgi:hypothetical protein
MFARRLFIGLVLLFFLALNASAQLAFNAAQTPVSIANNPRTLLRADFNHDGRPDLVTWSSEPRFSVLLNDKAGHFTEITTTTPKPVERLAVADFNKDGFNDVAVCSPTTTTTDPSRTISIYRGSGNGNFALAGTPVAITKACAGLTAGDINGDGNPDLVVVERTCTDSGCAHYQKAIAVYKGDGTGNFGAPVITSAVGSILDSNRISGGFLHDFQGADLADFNQDGFLDVIMAQCCHRDPTTGNPSGGGVLIAFGDGAGHFPTTQLFSPAFEFGDEDGEFLARVADTNADSVPDFTSSSLGQEGPIIRGTAWQSKSAGGYTPFELSRAEEFPDFHGSFLSTPVAPDLNNDGIKDGAASSGSTDATPLAQQIDTRLGNSGGGYGPAQTFTLSEKIDDIVTADFDGDGRADIAGIGPGALTVALNRTAVARCSAPSGSIRLINMCLAPSSNNLKVQANSNDNWNVVATKIYIDGDPKAAFFTTDDLVTRNFSLAPGTHSITVRMWDQHGPFSSSRTVTVPNSACSPSTTNRTVKICAPVDGAGMRQNLRVQAAITNSKPISEVKIYLDGTVVFSNSTAKTLDVTSTKVLSAGLHRITVKAWDSAGPFSKTIVVRK